MFYHFLFLTQTDHFAKPVAHAKAIIAFAKWLVWVKNIKKPKTCEKRFYNNVRILLCQKNCSEKHQIFEKGDTF